MFHITRINKFISEAGIASRRSADRMIMDGRVRINNNKAILGDIILDNDVVYIDEKLIKRTEDEVILIFHKPVGITCTSNHSDKNNVIDFIGYPKRIYPIGRLDKYSEGLLLMTNNGYLANRIMHSREGHEKEYIVTVNKTVTADFVNGMSHGVPIYKDITTRRCLVKKIGDRKFKIILKQGLNRQIRRMCEYFGYSVCKLIRVRIINIELKDLKVGCYRYISKSERKELLAALGFGTQHKI